MTRQDGERLVKAYRRKPAHTKNLQLEYSARCPGGRLAPQDEAVGFKKGAGRYRTARAMYLGMVGYIGYVFCNLTMECYELVADYTYQSAMHSRAPRCRMVNGDLLSIFRLSSPIQ